MNRNTIRLVALFFFANTMTFATQSFDDDYDAPDESIPVIGKVSEFSSNPGVPKTLWGERIAAQGRTIREGERLFTVAGQSLEITLNDGTKIEIGSSTILKFSNWTERSGKNNFLIKRIEIKRGLAVFKMGKTYSQQESFLVETPFGIIKVMGREFVVDTGESSAFVKSGTRTQGARKRAEKETMIHVLEGLFYFACNEAGFKTPGEHLLLRAGLYSTCQKNWEKPQQASPFDGDDFGRYVASAIPESKLKVNREFSMSEKSAQAFHVEPDNNPVAGGINRQIASEKVEDASDIINSGVDILSQRYLEKESTHARTWKNATRRDRLITEKAEMLK